MADDERSGQCEPWNALAQPFDESFLPVLPVSATHPSKHCIRGVLKGHVHVRHDPRMPRQKLEECLVDHFGIEIKEAHPPNSLDVCHAAHEIGQWNAALAREVPPPTNGVLRDQV